MSFWQSKTGAPITGNPNDAFTKDFSVIPDGTTAHAGIKEFCLVEKEFNGSKNRFYQITWKILNGDFKDREVTQKIKTFDQKPEIAQRALNMMMLIYKLTNHSPAHDMAPEDRDLKVFVGSQLGIKIAEWQMPKKDGSGIMEGNHVTEVHPITAAFKVETGVKKEVTTAHSQPQYDNSYFEPPKGLELNDDIPW